MVKIEYKVLKPFVIYKDSKGIKRIARTDKEKKSGANFDLTTKYFDYEIKEDQIKQDPFTLNLCKLRYLKMVKQVDIPKTSNL
ncbi:MAG: hypothetical protein U9Q67_04995 [Patescibacteria group bacterium]|nr:hypothetical protein [Patescibacteria group bacterium]